ncbi:MAG: rod shape-determining protein MreD [Gammaproteobacteria bacterium]
MIGATVRGRWMLSTLAAFVLQVVPLPWWLAVVRPPLSVITVIFWSLIAPRIGGIGLAFLVGLALDIYRGVIFGQHALALSFVAYVAIRQHLLVRNKPMFEQTLFAASLLFAFEAITWAIDGWTGHATGGWTRWLPVLTGALLWPLTSSWQASENRARR